jgi:hypothetical protein
MDPIPRIDIKHIEKFDGTNFQQWKHGLSMQLELSGLQDLVEVNELSVILLTKDKANHNLNQIKRCS